MTVESMSHTKPSGKRTRFLQTKQSKYGCLTCKARKIKCDETLPYCLRCQRSSRPCQGYSRTRSAAESEKTEGAVSDPPSSDETSSLPVANYRTPNPESISDYTAGASVQQRRLAALGFVVLASDPLQLSENPNAAIWANFLPQYIHSIPAVSAAVAAFGAAYEASVLRRGEVSHQLTSSLQYGHALRLVANELRVIPNGHLPLLLAITSLAAAETIQFHYTDAMSHMLGAFEILNLHGDEPNTSRTSSKSLVKSSRRSLLRDHAELTPFFLGLDLQLAMFDSNQIPHMAPVGYDEITIQKEDIQSLLRYQPLLIHACWSLIARASPYKYKSSTEHPQELILAHNRLISQLNAWFKSTRLRMKELQATAEKDENARRTLRNLTLLNLQSLCVYMLTCNITRPGQKCYDVYASEFEEILRCVETLLKPSQNVQKSVPVSFRSTPGIIQPLFFVAWKYRHSIHRRRAIALLDSVGIEGPWNSSFEAAVCARIVELEESRPFVPLISESEKLLPEDIPEASRIGGFRRTGDVVIDPDGTYKRKVSFRLGWPSSPEELEDAFRGLPVRWKTWEEDIPFTI